MVKSNSDYDVIPFPLIRKLVVDSGRTGKRKRSMVALVELDVTDARQIMADYKGKHGESLSFTAFIINCLGQVIDDNRIVQARRDFLGRLYLFHDVDCAVMIEIDYEGHKFPFAHVLRGVNKRSFRSIHEEVRAVKREPMRSDSLQKNHRIITLFLRLPWFLRDLVYWAGSRSPRIFKNLAGTIVVSAVGMYGKGGGWGIGPGSVYPMSFLIGGISEKPGITNGQIAIRKYLNLTADFDHDIIDGAPTARFLHQITDLIEGAYGLDDYR